MSAVELWWLGAKDVVRWLCTPVPTQQEAVREQLARDLLDRRAARMAATRTQKKAIEIAASGRKHIAVDLVGKTYQVKPPKSALAMRVAMSAKQADDDPMVMVEGLERWTKAAFGEKTSEAVWARMDDPDDDLDIPHLMQLMEALMEITSGNPTS